MKIKGIFFVTAFTWALGIGAATKAMAVVPNCSVVTPVTESCGWVITTPGCYKLQNNLTATTDAGDCIQVNSSNVYLDLNTQTITGTGATSTGVGIHVLSVTTPGNVAITNVAVQGGRAISGFDYGVVVGGTATTFVTKVRLDNLTVLNSKHAGFSLGNAKLSELSGLYSGGTYAGGLTGTFDGLSISGGSGNRVSNSIFTTNVNGVSVFLSNANVLSGVTASSNLFGFVIEQSTGNQINSPSADFNAAGGTGIFLGQTANNNVILGGHAHSNNVGIWVRQSSGNEISGIDLSNNLQIGIYLGCDGTTSGTCNSGVSGLPPSNNNGIDANINITSAGGSPSWGIVIDKGNKGNTIVGNSSSANPTFDEYDANACGANNWFANNFGTSNESCVH